jgi:hypothetical protein
MKEGIIRLDQTIKHKETPVNAAAFFVLVRDIGLPFSVNVFPRAHM